MRIASTSSVKTSPRNSIEQLLKDFNDDQMLFQLEVDAYEQERLHVECQAVVATQSTAPTTEKRTSEPAATTHTTEARQEGTAPATTNTPPEQHKEKTTLPEPRPIYVTQQEASDTPNTTETQPSPTTLQPPVPRYTNEPTIEGLPTDQPELTQAPEDILGILEED